MAKIIYTDDSFFGNYDLAEKLLKTEYTNIGKPQRFRKLNELHNKQVKCYTCVRKRIKNLFEDKDSLYRKETAER